jgi:hypothetical protein
MRHGQRRLASSRLAGPSAGTVTRCLASPEDIARTPIPARKGTASVTLRNRNRQSRRLHSSSPAPSSSASVRKQPNSSFSSKTTSSEDRIAVYGYFKNGKLRKTPDVQLNYDEFIVELVDDFDGAGLKEERRKSSRPYHVYSRNLRAARSFGNILPAAALLMDEARKLAPNLVERSSRAFRAFDLTVCLMV